MSRYHDASAAILRDPDFLDRLAILAVEASAAGDHLMAHKCRRALDGHRPSAWDCADALAHADAQDGAQVAAPPARLARDYRDGDRVQSSGRGRTALWPRVVAGYVSAVRGAMVIVMWDRECCEDEMAAIELVPEVAP